MKQIKELQKRSDLGEGRDYGIGFTILNKISKDNYETYLPFTACRDYLNDFSYVEYTKTEIGTIHGYNHKLLNCFDKKRLFFLGVNTLHNNHGGNWKLKDEATKILIDNRDNLQKIINIIETKLWLKSRTTITIDEDTLIFRCPLYWSKTTALISAFTLIIRCYFNFDKEYSIENLTNHKCIIDADNYMIQSVIEFINNIGKYTYDKIDYDKLEIKSASNVHNFGIQGYLSKIKQNV